MSSAKYIKQAIIASLCGHPEAEKYRQRAFSGDNLEKTMEAMAQHSQTLTKADFLAADDDGKFIIDSEGAWNNFGKIAKIVQANGDSFTYDDFMKPLDGKDQGKTLLDSAVAHNGLGNVFTFEVWLGRYEEMERLWFKVPMPNRKEIFKNNGLTAVSLKRQLFAAEGKTTPEDRLAKARLTPYDLAAAFSWRGEFDEFANKLTQAGDYLRKEYALLMIDGSGNTVFESASAWNRYETVVKAMQDNGERFEVADFIRQVSYAKNILARAAEHGALAKVFTPAHWVDRLPDMLSLWSYVLDGWKTASMTTRDFDNAYAEAESATYAARFDARPAGGKASLLSPLNEPSEKPVLPLGLKAVWSKFNAVQAELASQGEKLSIADLRAPTGEMGNSCLMCAVKFGHFDKVLEISKQSAEPITLDDFLSKDRHGNTLLAILAEKNQLALAFAPDLWAGRVAEMKTLWSRVSVTQRHQVDFAQAEVNAKQATLKLKKGGFKIQPKPPKGE